MSHDLCTKTTLMSSNLHVKNECFNLNVGSIHKYFGLNPSIEDCDVLIIDVGYYCEIHVTCAVSSGVSSEPAATWWRNHTHHIDKVSPLYEWWCAVVDPWSWCMCSHIVYTAVSCLLYESLDVRLDGFYVQISYCILSNSKLCNCCCVLSCAD